jgi:hypothetical protein
MTNKPKKLTFFDKSHIFDQKASNRSSWPILIEFEYFIQQKCSKLKKEH